MLIIIEKKQGTMGYDCWVYFLRCHVYHLSKVEFDLDVDLSRIDLKN